MKKFYLIASACVLLFNYSNAQKKGYVAVSLGINAPAGDFASKDVDNDKAGFANAGGAFDISFAYKFGKYFGICSKVDVGNNPVDKQPYLDKIEKEQPLITWTAETGDWSTVNMLFGGYGNFPLGESKLSFEAKLMMGFMVTNSPEIKLTGTLLGFSSWAKISSANGVSLALLIGGGIKYDVGNRICLLANMEIISGQPEFQNVKTTNSLGETEEDTFKQSIGTFNMNFGVGYRF